MVKTSGIERVPTGIDGLDGLIEGGFVRDSTVMVRGGTGTTKTIFSLQYLYKGITEYGEPGIFISFAEPEEAIYQHGNLFGWDLEALAKKNKFVIIRYEPHEVAGIMSEGGGTIRDTIDSMGAKRLVVDSLTAYELVFESHYKATESVLNLFEFLKKWKTTTLVTSEVPVTPQEDRGGRLGSLTDGIINLYYLRRQDHRYRALEVIKMRDTAHDDTINPFMIGKNGLKIKKD